MTRTTYAIFRSLLLLACFMSSRDANLHADPGPFGYTRCLSTEISKTQLQDIRSKIRNLLKGKQAVTKSQILVPVYFHIIQDSAVQNPATEDQIFQQVDILNSVFAPGDVSFTLEGIITTVNDTWALDLKAGSTDAFDMVSSLRVGDVQTLNIYLTDLGSGLLGYATFPWQYSEISGDDGVVVRSDTLPGGAALNYNLGGTIVHEVGHWLGLFHTFQPTGASSNGCKGGGDLVSDTPFEKVPHYVCRRSDSCRKQRGSDPIRNYMNYTPDSCFTGLSQGQFNLIQYMWAIYRTP